MSLSKFWLGTIGLFLCSFYLNKLENREIKLERKGSPLFLSLEMDSVDKIRLTSRDNKILTFLRYKGSFLLEEEAGYPVSNKKMNQFLYQISQSKVREDLGRQEKTDYGPYDKLEIFQGKKEPAYRYLLGRDHPRWGHFVLNEENGVIYLTDADFSLAFSKEKYLAEKPLQLPGEEILVIERNGSPLEEGDESFPQKINNLSIKGVMPLEKSGEMGLAFDQELLITLRNSISYRLSFAKRERKNFLKMEAFLAESPKNMVLNQNTKMDKIKEMDEFLKLREEVNFFNGRRVSWVFEVDHHDLFL